MQNEMRTQRRNVLAATGTVALLGVGGAAGITSGQTSSNIANAPVPASPNDYAYPTMGADDAPTATLYGNFKCPYTKEFVGRNLHAIIDEFVETGRLKIQFYNLAYDPGSTSSTFISSSDPRAAAMGNGVWDADPDSYWQFFAETFDDPLEGDVDGDELASRARAAGVSNADEIVERVRAGEYDANVEAISSEAAADGVTYTPTLELAGETTSPRHGTQDTLNWIEARLDDAPNETDAANGEGSSEQSEDESDDQDSADATESDEQADEPNGGPSESDAGSSESNARSSSSGSDTGSSETDADVIQTETKTEDGGGNATWNQNAECEGPWDTSDLWEQKQEC
ncbi:DsbA family protein [Natrinema salaciae]|uniref:Thioredoxin n=1 Tax=Natrinema salaciae TaxID=1186196 RepID=A0A1H9B8A3_9EURY|nr:thioredoxin domain-containing protein [Natrinema salaciae]SEP84967.1 Thioredoxin [Natrinema salaciae]